MPTCPDCGSELVIGDFPFGCGGDRLHAVHGGTLLSVIHPSDRPVIYRNPRTGEIRHPARSDQPVPPIYARQGFVREELTSPAAIKTYERSTGRIHEQSHYDNGSGTAERELAAHTAAPKITGLDDPST